MCVYNWGSVRAPQLSKFSHKYLDKDLLSFRSSLFPNFPCNHLSSQKLTNSPLNIISYNWASNWAQFPIPPIPSYTWPTNGFLTSCKLILYLYMFDAIIKLHGWLYLISFWCLCVANHPPNLSKRISIRKFKKWIGYFCFQTPPFLS